MWYRTLETCNVHLALFTRRQTDRQTESSFWSSFSPEPQSLIASPFGLTISPQFVVQRQNIYPRMLSVASRMLCTFASLPQFDEYWLLPSSPRAHCIPVTCLQVTSIHTCSRWDDWKITPQAAHLPKKSCDLEHQYNRTKSCMSTICSRYVRVIIFHGNGSL